MIANTIHFLFENFPLTFFLAGLCCALVKIYRHRINITRAYIAEAFIANYFLWCLGISLIYNGILHISFPTLAMNFMNRAGTPWCLITGFASIGLGIASLFTFKKDHRLRMGVVIASSVFLWGCAGGHLYQVSVNHDHAPAYQGIMLWVYLFQPLMSIAVLPLSSWFRKTEVPFQFFNHHQSFIAIPAKK